MTLLGHHPAWRALEAEGHAGPSIERLFRDHGRDVARVLRRFLGRRASEADIEDLVQQTFLLAHRDLSTFRGEAAPMTWLYRVASRVAIDHCRRRGRLERLREAVQTIADLARGASADDPEAIVLGRLELAHVQRALDGLSPKKRVVFVLHELEGLSGAEIAAALQIEEGTVWTRLYHARRELLRALPEALRRGGRP
jgi:RNA polymerase sigma-70 factor (ECF subfamily)